MNKIYNSSSLKKIINILKSKGKKIVLCHGAFDLFHPGHLDHLAKAKEKGHILVVSITKDKYIKNFLIEITYIPIDKFANNFIIYYVGYH